MTPEQLRKALAKGPAAPAYFFSAPEAGLMQEALEALAALVPEATRAFNVQVFHAFEADFAEVLTAERTMPFLAARRVVVLRDVEKARLDQLGRAELLEEYLAAPAPETRMTTPAKRKHRSWECIIEISRVQVRTDAHVTPACPARKRVLAGLAMLSLAAAGGAAPLPDVADQLRRADEIKAASYREFVAILDALERRSAELQPAQQQLLRYLRAWQRVYDGHYGSAITDLKSMVADPGDATLRFRAHATLVNVLVFANRYEDILTPDGADRSVAADPRWQCARAGTRRGRIALQPGGSVRTATATALFCCRAMSSNVLSSAGRLSMSLNACKPL